MQHKRPIVLESMRPRAEIWISLVLWEDLQVCIFCPAPRFSPGHPGIFFLLGVLMQLQLRGSFGMTTSTHLCLFSPPFARGEEPVK